MKLIARSQQTKLEAAQIECAGDSAYFRPAQGSDRIGQGRCVTNTSNEWSAPDRLPPVRSDGSREQDGFELSVPVSRLADDIERRRLLALFSATTAHGDHPQHGIVC
jgi:hypothetical protein